jgi:hypothetical protein
MAWYKTVPSPPASEGPGHPELCQNGTLRPPPHPFRTPTLSPRFVGRGGGGGKGGIRWGIEVAAKHLGGSARAPKVCHFGTHSPARLKCQSAIATRKSPVPSAHDQWIGWQTSPGTSNAQHRTPNIQCLPSARPLGVRCWMLDDGCSPPFASGVQSAKPSLGAFSPHCRLAAGPALRWCWERASPGQLRCASSVAPVYLW